MIQCTTQFLNQKKHIKIEDKKLFHEFHFTQQFLRNNSNILVTKADKGNEVVIMERLDYQNKMDLLLNDTGTYKKLDKNHINKIKDKCKEIVKKCKMKEYILEQTFRSLNITDCNLPRAYGLHC